MDTYHFIYFFFIIICSIVSCTCTKHGLDMHTFSIVFLLCICEQVWTLTYWRLRLVLWSVAFCSSWWELWAFSCSRKSKCFLLWISLKLMQETDLYEVYEFDLVCSSVQANRRSDWASLYLSKSRVFQPRWWWATFLSFLVCLMTSDRKCCGRCTFNFVLIEPEFITLTVLSI